MTGPHKRVLAVSLVLLTIFGTIGAVPVTALEAESDGTYTRPSAPGSTAEFRASVAAQPSDAITQNGLKTITLDFSADPDFSGSVAGVTARDVEVSINPNDTNGSVPAGPVEVSSNPAGDQLNVTLIDAYQNISSGDRVIVRADNVRNTEIAISNPQGLRGFAVDVSATGPQGGTDGPVEARYTIDPDAQPQGDNATQQNASTGANASDNATNTTTAGVEAGTTTSDETDTPATGATQTAAADSTAMASGMNATTTGGAETTTTMTATETETATDSTTAAPTSAAETASSGGSGGESTSTTGPGFGLVGALIALIAVSLLATRRRD